MFLFSDDYNNLYQEEYFVENRHDQSILSMVRKKLGSIVVENKIDIFSLSDTPDDNFLIVQKNDSFFYCFDKRSPFWATRIRR